MKNLLTILGTSVIGISSALGATLNAKTNFQTSLQQVTNQTTANDSIKTDINFHKEEWFDGTNSHSIFGGGDVIINYLNYENNWEDFKAKYPMAVMVGHIEVATMNNGWN
ncbi:hypothetical protein [Spiroplasma eriocheiris]|uniref:Uncharacterized protein n=1 Tax=Spiroplasma eriocheiris TaxID=315358 RepID=A0A0H3XK85_9MOLU|nr:hypothetical protein [Spiroplasma eriocheiris]AHF57844.1 hypothetical protein SPE_0722 [Spiroplasma eriocheiris CCTCC M 207170]AKM54291.1 hypothetical protein SERIO_v1c07270 [Spiroplasma eriocheiris]